MKAITWLASFSVAAVAMTSTALAATQEGWTTDYESAVAQAKKENKSVLLEFTGSDWCPPCKLMQKNVFSKKEFVEAASKNFILVKLDFPRADKAISEKNKPYAEKHEIQGYPTIILLDSAGKEFSRVVGAKYQSVDTFLEHINKALSNKDLD